MHHFLELMSLSLSERAYRVWAEGVYLACRHNGAYAITLHAFKNYYVEIWYKPARGGIVRVHPFWDVGQLAPFLEDVHLNALLEKN
jgi:hypothetical protein